MAVALFLIRWAAVRTMSAPAWGDSVHHTAIVQLIVENGGLFVSWTPYFPLESMTYHFGFHANAAVFSWITKLPTPQAVLTLSPLAIRLAGTRWAGIGAVAGAGLVANSVLAIGVYIPVSLLIGWAVGAVWKRWQERLAGRIAIVLSLSLCLAIMGAK